MQQIQLSRGYVALVDDADFDRLSRMRWYAHGKARVYARSLTHGFLHHHLLPKRPGYVVDHADGNSLNNVRANLRYLTASQNKLNAGAYRIAGQTSAHRGVHKRRSGWMARITIDQKTRSLGTFQTEEEAVKAYEMARHRVVEVRVNA